MHGLISSRKPKRELLMFGMLRLCLWQLFEHNIIHPDCSRDESVSAISYNSNTNLADIRRSLKFQHSTLPTIGGPLHDRKSHAAKPVSTTGFNGQLPRHLFSPQPR